MPNSLPNVQSPFSPRKSLGGATKPAFVTPQPKSQKTETAPSSSPEASSSGATVTDLQRLGRQVFELLLGAGDAGATAKDLLDFYGFVHGESLHAKIRRMGYAQLPELLSDIDPVFVVVATNKVFAAGTAEANRIVAARRKANQSSSSGGSSGNSEMTIIVDDGDTKVSPPPSSSSCSSSTPIPSSPPPFPEVCSVCLEAPQDTLCDPCGHLAMCRNCAPKLRACPICSASFTKLILVFRA